MSSTRIAILALLGIILALPAYADIAILTADSITATQGVTNPANAYGQFNGTVATTGQYLGTGDTVTMTLSNFSLAGTIDQINFTIRMAAAGVWSDDTIAIQYSNDSGTTWFNTPGAGLQPPNTLTYYGNYSVIATPAALNNTQVRLLYTRNGGRDGITSSIDGIEMYVRYTPPDTTPPTVNLTSPGNYTWRTSATVAFNFTPADNRGFLNCSLYLDSVFNSTNQTPVANGTNNTITVPGIIDGDHTWNVSCMDTSNLTGWSQNRIVRIDTSPPLVELTWPPDDWVSSTTVNSINFSVTDIAAVSSCILVVDNQQKDSISSPPKGVNVTMSTSLTTGDHDWYVNCTDENAWTFQSETRNISVQITVPTLVPLSDPRQGENVSYVGSNWQAGAIVIINLTLMNGSSSTTSALANASGNINATQAIGFGYPPGVYVANAYQENDTALNASASFNVISRLVNISTDADPYAQGETVTITGKGFAPDSTVRLTISYLGGENQTNITADSAGDFTYPYPLSLSQPLGMHNISAIDRNFSNLNASANFTVTVRSPRVRTNRTTYGNESVGVNGSYFSGFATVLLQVYNTVTSKLGRGFPFAMTADADGRFNYTWSVNNTCSGNYTVLAEDQNQTGLSANTTFIISHNLAQSLVNVPLRVAGGPTAPTISSVNASDGSLYTMGLTATLLNGYIEINFSPSIPRNSTFTSVVLMVEHRRTGSRAESYAVYVFNGTGYRAATAPGCSGVPPDVETNQTCTITSLVPNWSVANNLSVRVNYTRTSQGGAGDIEIDYAQVNYSWTGDPIGCFEFGDTAVVPYVSGLRVSPSTVVLNAGTTRTVECNFSVTDGNGAGEILGANVSVFTAPSSAHSPLTNVSKYQNSSCTQTGSTASRKDYSCTVPLLYYTANGTWTCEATATSTDGIGSSSAQFTVDPLYAINVEMPLLDFGDLSTETVSGNLSENITNYGNQPINVTVYGYGTTPGDGRSFTCPASSIPVGLMKFSWNITAGYGEKLNLTSNPSPAGISIPRQTDPALKRNFTYWQAYIPDTDDTGECTGVLVFEAIKQ